MLPSLYIAYTLPATEPDVRRYRPVRWSGLESFLRRGENTRFWKLYLAGENGTAYLPNISDDDEWVNSAQSIHLVAGEPVGEQISFPSTGGKTVLNLSTLAAGICGFPSLRFVILEGFESEDLAKRLISSGVPIVIDISQAGARAQMSMEVYQGLFRGQALMQSVQELSFTGINELRIQELKPEDAVPAWMEPAEHASARPGAYPDTLWVNANKKEHLAWSLPGGPVLLEKEADDSQPIPAKRRIRPNKPEAEAPEAEEKTARKRPIKKNNNEVDPKLPLKQRWAKWAGVSIAGLAAAIVVAVSFPALVPESVKGIFRRDGCPFPANDDNFRVLLLPVYRQGTCEQAGQSAITRMAERLALLHQKLGLEVSTVQRQAGSCPPGREQAIQVGDYCRADLVVWGEISQTENGEEAVWLHLMATDTLNYPLPAQKGFLSYRFSTDDLYASQPGFSEPVEQLVNWALARRYQLADQAEKAIFYLERITATDEAWQTRVDQLRTEAYIRIGQMEKALEPVNQLIQTHPDDPAAYYRRANLLARASYFSRAIADYSQSLFIDPGFTNALVGRAVVYQQSGNYPAAVADFSKVIALQPDLAPIYLSRAKTFLQMGARRLALEDLHTALRLYPDFPDALIARAELFRSEGNMEKAQADIKALLNRYPNYPDARLFDAQSEALRGNLEQALAMYQHVLGTYPTAEGYLQRAQTLILLNRLEDALSDLDKSIQMKPGDMRLRYARADLLESMGRFGNSLEDVEYILRSQPGSAQARMAKGALLVRLGRQKDAEAQFRSAWESNPSYPPACLALVNYYLDTDRPDQASAVAGEGVAKYPNQPDFLVVRGRVYARLRFHKNALADLQRALELNPKLPEAWLERGRVYLETGAFDAAYRDVAAALELDPRLLDAHLLIAKLELYRQNFDRAKVALDQAMLLQPGGAEALVLLAEMKYLQGQPQAALDELEKALRRNPNAYPYLRLKAQWLARMGMIQESLQAYSEAVRYAGSDINAIIDRSLLFLQLNQTDKAAEALDQAARAAPNHARVLGTQARILLKRNPANLAQALELLDKGLLADPLSAELYTLRGEVYAEAEKIGQAMADLNRAIDLNPNYAPAYLARGHMGRRASLFDRAIADFSRALEKEPLLAEAWYQRGFIQYLNNQYAPALTDIEKAVDLAPNQPVYLILLAKLYARNGQEEACFAALDRALKNKIPPAELKDPDFNVYRDKPRFRQLLSTAEAGR